MTREREVAIWRELIRRERLGRLLGSQCYVDGFCSVLMGELGGDNYYPMAWHRGACDPARCLLYYDHRRCLRTMTLYAEGYRSGCEDAAAWLRELVGQHWDGRRCERCGEPLTGKRSQIYCSPRCRIAAYRARQEAVTVQSVTTTEEPAA